MTYFIQRLFKDRRFWLMILLLTLFVNLNIFLLIRQQQFFRPNDMTFLASPTIGKFPQRLVLWILPAYLSLSVSGWYNQDFKLGQDKLLITRMTKHHYLKRLLFLSFFSAAITIFIVLTINYGLTWLFFRKYTDPLFSNLRTFTNDSMYTLLVWEVRHATLTNFIYILITAVITGIFSTLITALTFWLKKLNYVFIIIILLWMVQLPQSYSLMYIMQPFIETNLLSKFLIFLVYFFSSSLIIWLCYHYGVHEDDL